MSTLQKISAVMLTATALSIASMEQAQAALITGVSVTTNMGTSTGNINNIVNGSGLNGAGIHSVSLPGNSWLSAANQTSGEIIFNLGNQYNLTEIKIWNLIGTLGRNFGVKEVSFQTAQPGAGYSPLTFNLSGINVIPQGPNGFLASSAASASFTVPNVLAQYIKFNVQNNYAGAGILVANATGLSEVQFFGTPNAAIPTPALLPGLVGLGMTALRKRREKGAAVAA